MVHTEGLTRRFGDLVAVDGIDLRVAKGEIFGIVGPDGSGKTTTLRMLSGLINPTAGHATVAGYDVVSQTNQVKDRIGYMAQRFGLYTGLTVRENMDFYADLFGISAGDREALGKRLLHMTRMEPFGTRLAGQLSGGMKQKLGLMCTLLHRPEILFLDEPTNGVDPVSRRDFWTILYELVRDGLTVVVTTAYLDEAERCDRVALMHRGKIIQAGKPETLKRSLDEICYEVRTSDNRQAREALQPIGGVLSATPAGDSLHVFAGNQAPRNVLEQVLTQAGLQVRQIEAIAPSLEDVFIALIEKETKRRQKQ
ncbi:MAG: ATP-binding cassette domain-containing protein [Acidobacteriota bacterium]